MDSSADLFEASAGEWSEGLVQHKEYADIFVVFGLEESGARIYLKIYRNYPTFALEFLGYSKTLGRASWLEDQASALAAAIEFRKKLGTFHGIYVQSFMHAALSVKTFRKGEFAQTRYPAMMLNEQNELDPPGDIY